MRKVDLEVLERMLYPVVPVLVTAEYNGRVGGMLAAWWMQASFEPPLLAVAIAPERYTYKLVSKSRKFAFNLLDYRYVDRMPYLGDVSERFYKNKITRAGFHIIRGEVLGVPLVAEACAAVELKLVDIVKAGDHDIFIGEAVAAYAVEDFENGMWRLQEYKPLLYLGRTRRPGPVYRVYLTPMGWERREIEFARGDLKEASKRRIKVMEEIVEIVRQASSKEEAVEHVWKYLVESGLEEDDAELLVDEAVRRLGRK